MTRLNSESLMGIGLTTLASSAELAGHGINNKEGKHMNKIESNAKRLMLFIALLLPILIAGCGVGKWDGPKLLSVTVAPAGQSAPKAVTTQFTATGIYSDGTSRDVTDSATWSSSDTTIATISNRGVVIGTGVGTAVITAAYGGQTFSTNFTVTPATLNSIVIVPASPTLFIGLTDRFTALGVYSDGTSQVLTGQTAWTSSDPTVASMSTDGPATGGVAAGLKAGSTTITATFGGKTETGTLVVSPATLSSISVTPAPLQIVKGLTGRFTAVGIFSNGGTADITTSAAWSSSDTTVATLSPDGVAGGVATGVNTGSAVITATFSGKSQGAALAVTAPVLSSIAVSPAIKNTGIGQTSQFQAVGIYDDGSNADLTGSVSWASGNTLIATMNPSFLTTSGLATGVTLGSTTVIATFGGKVGTATLNVTAAGPTGANPTAPTLGQTARFAILASQAVTTTTGSLISNGDLGIIDQARSFYAGFTAGANPGQFDQLINGLSYAHDDVDPALRAGFPTTIAFLDQVRTDLGGAYTFLGADPNPGAPTQVCPIELGNRTLTRGVYKTTSNVTLTSGTLHLDAQGDSTSVWIFTIDGTLATGAPGGSISLENGAQAKNVFWRTAGETVIGANTTFFGNVFAQTQVRVLTGANVTGRLFAKTAQVTLQSNVLTKAP
jgi:trimeric autotransporter adhesin